MVVGWRGRSGAPIRRCTRGAALTASRYTHHSTRNTARERLNADPRIILRQGARVVKDAALALARSTPGGQEISLGIKLQHRWRGFEAFRCRRVLHRPLFLLN